MTTEELLKQKISNLEKEIIFLTKNVNKLGEDTETTRRKIVSLKKEGSASNEELLPHLKSFRSNYYDLEMQTRVSEAKLALFIELVLLAKSAGIELNLTEETEKEIPILKGRFEFPIIIDTDKETISFKDEEFYKIHVEKFINAIDEENAFKQFLNSPLLNA